MGASEKQTHDMKVVGNRAIDADVNDRTLSYGYSATGKKRLDVAIHGSSTRNKLFVDASTDEVKLSGAMRPASFNAIPRRFELKWVAGAGRLPALNAVIALDENSNAAAHLAANVADRDFEILGTNASTDDVSFYAEGGVAMETDGASGDQVILLPHLDSGQTAWSAITWGTDKSVEWECDLSSWSNIADIIIWAGLKLTNTSTTATDNDQAFFRFAPATASGQWQAVYSIGGTDTETSSGVTVAASTRYHLKIVIDSSRIARFYINGALVATSTALTDATDLIPYIGVQASAAAAKKIIAHGQAISRVIG